jgi:hypothetical protein
LINDQEHCIAGADEAARANGVIAVAAKWAMIFFLWLRNVRVAKGCLTTI